MSLARLDCLMPQSSRHHSHRHAGGRRRLGRRLAVAMLIPAGTAGGLAALSTSQGSAMATLMVKPNPAAARPVGRVPLARPLTESPAASPVVADTPVLDGAGVTSLIDRIFPPDARGRARAIAWCESRLDPESVGADPDGTHDWGVFQLNDGGTLRALGGTPAAALDARWNVLAAKRLYDERGFEPWTCRRQT